MSFCHHRLGRIADVDLGIWFFLLFKNIEFIELPINLSFKILLICIFVVEIKFSKVKCWIIVIKSWKIIVSNVGWAATDFMILKRFSFVPWRSFLKRTKYFIMDLVWLFLFILIKYFIYFRPINIKIIQFHRLNLILDWFDLIFQGHKWR